MRRSARWPGCPRQVPAIAGVAVAAAAPRLSFSSQCWFSSRQSSNSLEDPSAYGFDPPGTISWDGKTTCDLVSFVGRVTRDVQILQLGSRLLANAFLDIRESCPNRDGDGSPDHHDVGPYHDDAHGGGHYSAHDGSRSGTTHHICVEFSKDLARSAVAFLRIRDLIHVNGTLSLSTSNIPGSCFDSKIRAHDFHFVRVPTETEHDDDCFARREARPIIPCLQTSRYERWEQYFKDPSQWLDLRHRKWCSRSPDFKHKTEGYGLWLSPRMYPEWVTKRLEEVDARKKAASISGDTDTRRAIPSSVTHGNLNHHHHDYDSHCEYECDHHRRHHKANYGCFNHERKEHIAALWHSVFTAPWEWWDHTHSKRHRNYPDYKHKITGEGLWINSFLNPPWVGGQLANMRVKPTQAGKSLNKGTYLNSSMTDEELGLTRFEDKDLEPP